MVDSGTGATAVGLALGAALAGAPWTVHGVMLAGDRTYYEAQQRALAAAFCSSFPPGEEVPVRSLKDPWERVHLWPVGGWPCACTECVNCFARHHLSLCRCRTSLALLRGRLCNHGKEVGFGLSVTMHL